MRDTWRGAMSEIPEHGNAGAGIYSWASTFADQNAAMSALVGVFFENGRLEGYVRCFPRVRRSPYAERGLWRMASAEIYTYSLMSRAGGIAPSCMAERVSDVASVASGISRKTVGPSAWRYVATVVVAVSDR